jgi:hypothetical protein
MRRPFGGGIVVKRVPTTNAMAFLADISVRGDETLTDQTASVTIRE